TERRSKRFHLILIAAGFQEFPLLQRKFHSLPVIKAAFILFRKFYPERLINTTFRNCNMNLKFYGIHSCPCKSIYIGLCHSQTAFMGLANFCNYGHTFKTIFMEPAVNSFSEYCLKSLCTG